MGLGSRSNAERMATLSATFPEPANCEIWLCPEASVYGPDRAENQRRRAEMNPASLVGAER